MEEHMNNCDNKLSIANLNQAVLVEYKSLRPTKCQSVVNSTQ
jgi:hypothetical protein